MRILSAVVLVLLLGAAQVAEADTANAWGMAANSCVPTSGTTNSGILNTTSNYVGYVGADTGLIVVNCPVTNATDIGQVVGMTLLYTDSTTAASNVVEAALHRIDFNGGDTLLAYVDTDTGGT